MYHYIKRISAGLLATGLLVSVSGMSYAKTTHVVLSQQQSAFQSLTAAQRHKVIQEANPYVHTLKNGKVTVATNALAHRGMDGLDIAFVKSLIHTYNVKVANGTIRPQAPNAVHRGTLTLEGDPSTGGLPYSWFVAAKPLVYTQNFWWGQSTILNELATSKTEGFLWALAGGAELASATSAYLGWAPGGLSASLLLAGVAGGYGSEAGLMEGVDNGYGNHYNQTWVSEPLGIYANVP